MIRNIYILLLLSLSFGTVTDIDGNIYETVQIGEQLWMSENLKVTHYNNGDEIQYVQSESSEPDVWVNLSTGAYGYYNDDPSLLDTYGNLYNWYAVDDERGICPEGWHVPSDDEIKTLEIYLGMDPDEADDTSWRGTDEGSQLAGNEELWTNENLDNNEVFGTSGFNVLPAGYRYNFTGFYNHMGSSGYFWSSSGSSSTNAWRRNLDYDFSSVNRYVGSNQYGFSIRCLQDEITTGCTDPEACNYDETALADDGSCIYPEENYDCDGNCIVEIDCAGECGGSAMFDYCCDECVGGNTGIIIGDCDADDDGVCDDVDNCPYTANTDQLNYDNDAEGDACDPDDDNDGCVDWEDPYPYTFSIDTDNDGEGNDCDDDDDGDGCYDWEDDFPLIWSPDCECIYWLNSDCYCYDCYCLCPDCEDDCQGWCEGSGCPEIDSDGDGVIDSEDSDPNNPFVCMDSDNDTCDDCSSGYFDPSNDGIDTDADGICDSGDPDDDNDGCLDDVDENPLVWSPDTNGNGLGSDCEFACPNDGLHNGDGFWLNDDCFCCECNTCDCEDWCGICFDSLGNESDCYLNDNCFSNQYQDWYEDLDGDGLGSDVLCEEALCTDITELTGCVLNSDDPDDYCYSNMYEDYCHDTDGDGNCGCEITENVCTDFADDYCGSDSICCLDMEPQIFCESNTFNTYYYDNDGDGLGGELADDYLCSDDAEDDWVLNDNDLDDSIYCFSNIIDECGVCDGDGYGADCVGTDDCLNMDCSGECFGDAEVGTYWYDADGDGLGYGQGMEYCSTNVTQGWVPNNLDEDDSCSSNSIDVLGVCCYSNDFDECGVCDGDGSFCTNLEAILSFGEVDLASQTIEINLENSAPVSGFQFLLSSADSLDFVDAYGGSSEENGFTVDIGGNNIVLGYSLSATEIPTGNDILTYIEFDGFTSNEICLSEGVITSGYDYAEFFDVSYGDCISPYLKGDVNMDGVLDVLDIVTIVSIIFEEIIPDEYEIWASDYNSDVEINVMDVVQIVNCILTDCWEEEPSLCDGLTEVELWGEWYDIGTTTSIGLYNQGYGQGLTGSIPPEIGCLTNLTILDLSNNQLTGEIPPEIGNLTNLEGLYLWSNNLTGEIPSEIGNLTNLTGLDLFNNQLTGEIPSWIGNLTNLTFLVLSSNQYIGGIPPEIGNLTNLTGLFLNHNQLTGEIPSWIGDLTNLTFLALHENQLTGEIPSEIGNLTNLHTLYLKWNQLTGEIPQEVCDLIESNNLNMGYIVDGNNLTNTCE